MLNLKGEWMSKRAKQTTTTTKKLHGMKWNVVMMRKIDESWTRRRKWCWWWWWWWWWWWRRRRWKQQQQYQTDNDTNDREKWISKKNLSYIITFEFQQIFFCSLSCRVVFLFSFIFPPLLYVRIFRVLFFCIKSIIN